MKAKAVFAFIVGFALCSAAIAGNLFWIRDVVTSPSGWTWTNDLKRPVMTQSALLQGNGSVSFQLKSRFGWEFQYRPPEVVTNEFGEIVTNRYNQVTNVLVYERTFTLGPFTVVSNALITTGLSGIITLEGDVWTVSAPTGTVFFLHFSD